MNHYQSVHSTPRFPSWIGIDSSTNNDTEAHTFRTGNATRSCARGRAAAEVGRNCVSTTTKTSKERREGGDTEPKSRKCRNDIRSNKMIHSSTTTPMKEAEKDSLLIQLCKQKEWKSVLARCQSHPTEAKPSLYVRSKQEQLQEHDKFTKNKVNTDNNSPLIHNDTALGLVCSAVTATSSAYLNPSHQQTNYSLSYSHPHLHLNHKKVVFESLTIKYAASSSSNTKALMAENSNDVTELIEKLVQVCPQQVQCSQRYPGHTPLRDVCMNINSSPKILEILLEADAKVIAFTSLASPENDDTYNIMNRSSYNTLPATYQQDRDGLYPIDHLIINVQRNYNKNPKNSIDLLKTFVKVTTSSPGYDKSYYSGSTSPLIKLLSADNSYGVSSTTTGGNYKHCYDNNDGSSMLSMSSSSTTRLSRVYDCVVFLLENNPSLIAKCSKTTGCTPLHTALRNYGNCKKLINLLIDYDGYSCDNTTTASSTTPSAGGYSALKQRNNFGDLPLHVACSVGVPLDVLYLVLEKTLLAMPIYSSNNDNNNNTSEFLAPHPLIWAVNNSGYTPVDLEWVRHIENGKSLHTARTFYPLEVSGIRRHCSRQDEFYRELLQQAVDQVFQMARDDYENNRDNNATTSVTIRGSDGPRSSPPLSPLPMPLTVNNSSRSSTSRHHEAELKNKEQEGKITDDDESKIQRSDAMNKTFGHVLHRIFLIVNAAFTGEGSFAFSCSSSSSATTSTNKNHHLDSPPFLLHAACALSSQPGPSIPQPLLELIHWFNREQFFTKDHTGSLPVHHLLKPRRRRVTARRRSEKNTKTTKSRGTPGETPARCNSTSDNSRIAVDRRMARRRSIHEVLPDSHNSQYHNRQLSRTKSSDDWKNWCMTLLQKTPSLCTVTDGKGRLPLHLALTSSDSLSDDYDSDCNTGNVEEMKTARAGIIKTLVGMYPESVHIHDPCSGLFPFMQAAASPDIPLDTVFYLLLQSPNVLTNLCQLQK